MGRQHFTSGLLAGVTAAVIWMAACMIVGGFGSAVIGIGALVLLVLTTLVATLIANAVGRNVRPTTAE